jgi:glutathione synthase/RimK-type ligase-like ATP-grasp enzyme
MAKQKTIGIVFSHLASKKDPLSRVGKKRVVYLEFLKKCIEKGFYTVVVSRKYYQSSGIFDIYWTLSTQDVLEKVNSKIKVDLAYDRTGGLHFPLVDDPLRVVDNREFKVLAWNKWLQFQEIGQYMPKTVLVDKLDLSASLSELKTDMVVMKPVNGLRGLGIFIGNKSDALDFKFPKNETSSPFAENQERKLVDECDGFLLRRDFTPDEAIGKNPDRKVEGVSYIAQEFVETKGGISGITKSRHDLRVVIINNKIVWSHVRIPKEGNLKANVSGGNGGELCEVEVSKLPKSVVEICDVVSKDFYKKYDNPIYSLDFGFDESGKPYIFEINDQIGFPQMYMKAKDAFLDELVENFRSKLSTT